MATTDRRAVVGVFRDRGDAERAVDLLHRAGFREDQIGFAARGGDDIEGGRAIEGSDTGHAGSGAATGILGGGLVGGILGALATGLIPGVGPVIAGGLLAGILGGAAVGAAAGGLLGALAGMGVPEEEARYYDTEFQAGRTVVTVQADGRMDEARSIMQRAGAYDFETRDGQTETTTTRMGAATPGAATARTERGTAPRMAAGREELTGGERTVELREERLRPERETVQTGEVTVGKEVVSEQQTIDVPVTHEEVVVERHRVEPRPSDRPIGAGETIEVPVREERVELGKEQVVYEEIEVGKRQVQETQHVSGTVRREEARIEREGDVDMAGAGMGTGARTGAAGFRSWDEVGPTYQQEWERRYGNSGMRWHDVEPYRRYSYEMSHDRRYQGRPWNEVETDLRSNYGDWSRRSGYNHDDSAWERFKDQMRGAWDETRQTARGR